MFSCATPEIRKLVVNNRCLLKEEIVIVFKIIFHEIRRKILQKIAEH